MLSGIWAVNQTSRGRYLIMKPARQNNGKVYESNLRPINLYSVAVQVFSPDTDLNQLFVASEELKKHYSYSYRERQGKNRETKAIFIKGKTREDF